MPDDDGSPTPEEVEEEVSELTMRIIGGEFDGHLVQLAAACGNRFQLPDGPIGKWRCDLRDLHFTEDDLLFEDYCKWSTATGRPWTSLRPLQGDPLICRALLLIVAESTLKKSPTAAKKWLGTLTGTEVVEAFTEYEVEPSPLASGD